ncbi:MAG: GNAT family N-acetyltransferase, partial [Pacificimonas sp.]
MTIGFRAASVDDVRLLAGLAKASFDPLYGEGWTGAQLVGTLAQPAAWGEIIARDGQAAGFTLSRFAADEAELLLVAVDPSARGCGIGGALMRHVMDGARARGAAIMH